MHCCYNSYSDSALLLRCREKAHVPPRSQSLRLDEGMKSTRPNECRSPEILGPLHVLRMAEFQAVGFLAACLPTCSFMLRTARSILTHQVYETRGSRYTFLDLRIESRRHERHLERIKRRKIGARYFLDFWYRNCLMNDLTHGIMTSTI